MSVILVVAIMVSQDETTTHLSQAAVQEIKMSYHSGYMVNMGLP